MTRSFPKQAFRFAPSSNGFLHLGHACSAALNFELAQASGGRMLLRIEDIDLERCRPEFEQAIYDDLGWLGLAWEEPVRRQSRHFPDYAATLERLRAQGLAYPCFCSRGEIMAAVAGRPDWPRDPDGSPLYPGLCKHLSPMERTRRLASGRAAALRLDMKAALAHLARQGGPELDWLEQGVGGTRRVRATPALWGDPVIARRDIKTSYHIAVVTDDAAQGVTDVVRGADLFMATHLHRLLQALLDLPEPVYRHHALLCDASGQKLSKSLRAKSLRAWRQEGLSPEAARRRLSVEVMVPP
ncbi:tRNA glutamyl-Q(34) synthetase GluQRS [Methylocella sp.]|uniref:tRNA glutamyl-Q(34) synthetase GluQRS n=1 Tax=Methylocella sp. TaxID=1978226 RepID=UPI00378401AD